MHVTNPIGVGQRSKQEPLKNCHSPLQRNPSSHLPAESDSIQSAATAAAYITNPRSIDPSINLRFLFPLASNPPDPSHLMEEAPELGQLQAQGAESPSPPPASGSSPTHASAASFWFTGNERGRAPASSEAIQGLREVAAPTDGSSDCCAICLQDLSTDAKLRAMPCSHAFHQDCIFQWLRRSAACPLCRRQLPTEEEAEEKQVPMSRRVRYDEDGQPYMRITGNDLLEAEEEDLDEEEQQERAEELASWQTLMEQHQQ